MEFVRNFKQLNKDDVTIAGGKGASLGELTQTGISVPPGFVILSTAFEQFIKENNLSSKIDSALHSVNHKEIHTVENASERIKALILNAKIPKNIENQIKLHFKKLNTKYVAIRSSATAEDSSTAAWAGQLESYLNTTKENLLENVKKCWASLFTPRAIFYRFEKDLHKQKISVAVVVQKMIESEVSGIAFSVHPVTQDRNQLIIEAGFGLGEAIVSGQITPDNYVVEKKVWRILDKTIAKQEKSLIRNIVHGNKWIDVKEKEKQKLSDKEIIDLAKLIVKIEKHYGFPVDVEFARESGKFYIVQSRPITTLSQEPSKNDALVLLGVWNVLPLEAWRWFDTIAIEKLYKLTGIKIRVFTYVKDELHYECVFENELDQLRNIFEKKNTEKEQVNYINKICNDFYKEVTKLENYLQISEKKNFSNFSDKEIVQAIKNFADFWTCITMQIWYAVFLDIWYPLGKGYSKIGKQIIGKTRDYTGHLHERSNIIERKLYAEAARRMSIDYKMINYLFPNEIIDAILNNASYIDEIHKRQKFCVTTSIEGKYKIYSGNKAQELFEQYQPPSIGTEIKDKLIGTIANKGKAAGFVRVIHKDKDFDKFQEGEILVALQTMVHYLPLMKKSKAILTEFGGLTSHAAIVSRELNKPCIVGISNLLASVKDGDYVEVDANNGVVKILEEKTLKNIADDINKRDYILTFWARGLNVVVTDISNDMYVDLDVLDVLYEGVYYQYFRKNKFELALEKGVKFYGNNNEVKSYIANIRNNCNNLKNFFNNAIKNKDSSKKEDVVRFFKYSIDLLKQYTKMDFEYTDKAFTIKDKNKIIDKNLSIIIKLKDEIRNFINIVFFDRKGYLIKLLDILSKKFNIPLSVLERCTQDEIIGLFDDKKINEKEIEERSLAFVVISINGNKRYYSGKNAEVIANRLKDNIVETDKIKGQTANKGKIIGEVKVIPVDYSNLEKVNKEIKKMKKGSVLVAETTAPELIIACKKASAIVTDLGGLMSHAAIVSRELKLPCIVGTKYASRLLKDGYLVEVDANNGVVKILKK